MPDNDLAPYVVEAASRVQVAKKHHQAVEAGEEPDPEIDWEQLEETRCGSTGALKVQLQ